MIYMQIPSTCMFATIVVIEFIHTMQMSKLMSSFLMAPVHHHAYIMPLILMPGSLKEWAHVNMYNSKIIIFLLSLRGIVKSTSNAGYCDR